MKKKIKEQIKKNAVLIAGSTGVIVGVGLTLLLRQIGVKKNEKDTQEYIVGEAMKFIAEQTGISDDIIFKVLKSEDNYLTVIGF